MSSTPALPVIRSSAPRARRSASAAISRSAALRPPSSASSASRERRAMARVERDLALGAAEARLNAESALESARPGPRRSLTDTERSGARAGGAEIRLGVDQDRAVRARSPASPSQSTRSAAATDARARATPIASIASPRLAQAGGVDQQEGRAADRDRRLDQIAGRAGNRRGDRRVASDQRIEKARLSGIGRAGDDDPDAVPEPLRRRPGQPARQLVPQARASRRAEVRRAAARHRPRRRNRAPPRPAAASASSRACQASTCRLSAPPASASAARRCDSVSASSRSASPSASARSIRPFSKARRVNSPGCGRAAARRSGRAPPSTAATTARPPWRWSSATSSPVALAGPGKRMTSALSRTSPSARKRRERRAARLGQASRPAPPARHRRPGPLIRTTATAAGGAPEDKAKIVSVSGGAFPPIWPSICFHIVHAGLVHRPPGLHHLAEHFGRRRLRSPPPSSSRHRPRGPA